MLGGGTRWRWRIARGWDFVDVRLRRLGDAPMLQRFPDAIEGQNQSSQTTSRALEIGIRIGNYELLKSRLVVKQEVITNEDIQISGHSRYSPSSDGSFHSSIKGY